MGNMLIKRCTKRKKCKKLNDNISSQNDLCNDDLYGINNVIERDNVLYDCNIVIKSNVVSESSDVLERGDVLEGDDISYETVIPRPTLVIPPDHNELEYTSD